VSSATVCTIFGHHLGCFWSLQRAPANPGPCAAESTTPYRRETLELFTAAVNTRSLAIGAGGNITQRIEPDASDPRIWDVASSRMLNVQILDTRGFARVTGRRPPSTPITPDLYRYMGMPFYRLWRDNDGDDDRPDGGRGTAAGVPGALWGSQPIVGVKEAASQAMKAASGPVSGGLDVQKESAAGAGGKGRQVQMSDEEEGEEFTEPSFDFPVTLMDVDDTIAEFKSAVEVEEEFDPEEY